MAARGTIAKDVIIKKLYEVFPNAFEGDKCIRIPMQENGETIEIKVTLTAAKDIMGGVATTSPKNEDVVKVTETAAAPSQEEKENLKKFLAAMGG